MARDKKFSLPCCIIKHTLSALEQAHDSMRLWKLPSLQDLLKGVEDYIWLTCSITASESVTMFVNLDCNNVGLFFVCLFV